MHWDDFSKSILKKIEEDSNLPKNFGPTAKVYSWFQIRMAAREAFKAGRLFQHDYEKRMHGLFVGTTDD